MCKISGFNVEDVFLDDKNVGRIIQPRNYPLSIYIAGRSLSWCLGVPPAIYKFSGMRQWSSLYGRFMLELLEKFDCFCCWNCYNFIGATSYNAL